jgi:hypothetical protein
MMTAVYLHCNLNLNTLKYNYFLYRLHSLQYYSYSSIVYLGWSEDDIVTKLVTYFFMYVGMYDVLLLFYLFYLIKIKYLYLFVSLFEQNLGII